MSKNECIFCKIVIGKIPCKKIYEDDSVIAFLDIRPVSDGHTLVVPKAHFERLHQCPPEVLGSIGACVAKIAQAVVGAVGGGGYNVLCNNGRVAGQLVDHVHFHIIPRNEGDEVFTRWPAYEYEQGRADELAVKISENL
ncbi:MAG TPA: HIT family protein [Planctomycetes bacterium]|nr:HIT family protein [Planctomycetota bacterium]HIJ71010.1 HIT family protein [Planctomycetota bacterium]